MSYVICTNQSLFRPHADLNFAASDVESAADLLWFVHMWWFKSGMHEMYTAH